MALKTDDYDPTKAVKHLLYRVRCYLGGPGFRAVQPEIEDFMHDEVGEALRDAFREAKGLYIEQTFKQANQASRTLLEGVMAGAEIERRKHENE